MSKTSWRKPELLALFALLAFALGARCIFSAGVVFDESIFLAKQAWQIAYASKAVEIFRWLLAPPFADKLVVIVTALAYRAFGVSNISSFLPGLLSSLALIGFTVALANRWFGRPAALVAGFFLAVFPLEIFLATNLFSATVLLSMKIVALYLFFGATRRKVNWPLGWAAALAVLGLLADWTIFLPVVVLGLLIGFVDRKNYFLWMGSIAGLGFAVLAFLPGGIAAALALYDSALLLIENLIYLPLFFFALVYASKAITDERVRTLLLWVGLEAIFLFVAGSKIVSSDIFASIGIGAYWVQLLIPAIILLGQSFVERVGERAAFRAVALASVIVLLVLFLQVVDPSAAMQRAFDVVTRISLGVAFLLMWVFVFLMNSKGQAKSVVFAGFLLTCALGALMAAKMYSRSYSYLADSTAQAVDYLEANASSSDLVVAGDYLFYRVLYLNGFSENNDGVRFSLLERANKTTSPGNFVLVEENYQQNILGLKPDNWRLVAEFGQPDYRRLFLYQVE